MIILDRPIRINRGRLRLRLVVVSGWTELRKQFSEFGDRAWLKCSAWTGRDPADEKYFAEMWLCAKSITLDDVAHEAVHAAFAYHERVGRQVFKDSGTDDEEQIAYPAGRIVVSVVNELSLAGMSVM